jgi:hypothetical protein
MVVQINEWAQNASGEADVCCFARIVLVHAGGYIRSQEENILRVTEREEKIYSFFFAEYNKGWMTQS